MIDFLRHVAAYRAEQQDLEATRASLERALDVLQLQTRRVLALQQLYVRELRHSFATHEQQMALDALDVAQAEAAALLVEAGR